MKNVYIILLITFFSCQGGSSSEVISQESEDLAFDWLLGEWSRINEEGEKQTYESWKKIDDAAYIGFGYTLVNSDTVWKEHIQLMSTVEGWNFEVTGEGDSTSTVFKLTELGHDSFISQNPDHDFPTQIQYFMQGETLMAVISGEGVEIPFVFERIERE